MWLKSTKFYRCPRIIDSRFKKKIKLENLGSHLGFLSWWSPKRHLLAFFRRLGVRNIFEDPICCFDRLLIISSTEQGFNTENKSPEQVTKPSLFVDFSKISNYMTFYFTLRKKQEWHEIV